MSEEKQVKKNFIKIISYLMNKTFFQMIKQHNDVCSKKNKGIKKLCQYLDTANSHV